MPYPFEFRAVGEEEGARAAADGAQGAGAGAAAEAASGAPGAAQGVDEGEGEKAECGFCVFMKAGPCGDVFESWEKCVESGRTSGEDFVESCLEPTMALKNCMEAHTEYYAPVLEAEKTSLAGKAAGEGGEGEQAEAGAEGGGGERAGEAAPEHEAAQAAAAAPAPASTAEAAADTRERA